VNSSVNFSIGKEPADSSVHPVCLFSIRSRLQASYSLLKGVQTIALAALLALFSLNAAALEQRFTVYLDTDSNAATGCTVSTVSGGRGGAEAAFTAVVDTGSSPFRTVRLERQNCVAGGLSTAVVYDAAPIATESVGTLTGVTLWIPQSAFLAPTAQAFVASVNSAGDRDVTAAFQIVATAVPSDASVAVPLSPWLLALIALSVAGFGLRAGRSSQHWVAAFAMVLLVGSAATALAVVVNGANISWIGRTPVLVDAADANPNADVASIYTQSDANAVYVRVDADLRSDAATGANAAPSISGLVASAMLASPATPLALAATVTDDGLPNPPAALSLAWTQVSGLGTVTFTPANAASTSASFSAGGIYVIRLSASDGTLTTTRDVTVTVNAPSTGNAAPVISGLAASATVNLPSNTLSLTPNVTDDGLPSPPAALSYAWTQVSGPVAGSGQFPVSFSASNTKDTTVSFDLNGAGNYVLRLTVSDGARSSTADIAVTLIDIAQGAPTLAALADRSVTVGETLRVVLAADDPNFKQTLAYSLLSSPTGSSLAGTGNAVFTFTPSKSQVGSHAVSVNVADNSAPTPLSAQRGFNITVLDANQPPKFTVASKADGAIAGGGTFTRTLTATDPDAGETQTYSLVNGPAGMTVNAAGSLSWPSGVTTTPQAAIVKVADSAGNVDFARFTIAIQASAAPVATDDAYTVQIGNTLTVPAAQGVLTNDVDPAGLPMTAIKQTNPSKGAVSAFNADGSFTYIAPAVPAANTFAPTLVAQKQIHDASTGYNWQLVDLNGDGHADIVFNHLCFAVRGCLTAFDIKNNVQLWTTDASADGCTIGWANNSPFHIAVGDLDGDGIPDIVNLGHCGAQNTALTRILAFNGRTGAMKWRSLSVHEPAIEPFGPAALNGNMALTIARLRTGEKPSVLVGRVAAGSSGPGDGTYRAQCASIVESVSGGSYAFDAATPKHYYSCAGVIVLNGDTGAITQRMIQDAGDFRTGSDSLTQGQNGTGAIYPAIALDFDGSGQNKIMMLGAVWNLDGSTFGASKPSHTLALGIGNFDDTPDVELVLIEQKDAVRLIVKKADGRVLWSLPLPTSNTGHITVADIDGNGRPDVLLNVFFGDHAELWAIDHRGKVRWVHRLPCHPTAGCNNQAFYYMRVAAFDLDSDGVAEVMFPFQNELRFLDGVTGQVKGSVATLVVENGGWAYNPIARVADVDNDGHADVVLTSSGSLNCVINPACFTSVMVFSDAAKQWRPTRKIDNQFAYFAANISDDGTIPAAVPLSNNFATTFGNVFASQPQILTPIDPRLRDQTDFSYTANNGALSSVPATVKINIVPQNRPPTFTSTPPLRHNYTLNYPATAVDPDVGDTVTYAIDTQVTASGVPCTIGASSGLLSCTNLNGFSSDLGALILISATDSFGAKAVQSVSVVYSASSCTVPNVAGQTQVAASAALVAAGCSVGEISETNAATPSGQVISQSPAAASVILGGEAVALVVSIGPPPNVVPLVVGKSLSTANSALSNAGFVASITRVFSNTIPSDQVMSQSVAAGTLRAPGVPAIGLIVSSGTGLSIRLNRSLATADQTITVTPVALDVNGAPTPAPTLSYAITEAIAGFGVPLPTISGTTISSSALTFGSYRITATDSVGGRSASADFVIGQTPATDEDTHLQSYATMTDALDAIYALRPALRAARAANDVPAMTSLLQQIVSTWRGFDIDDVKLSMSIAPVDKFPLSVAEMRALGLSPTPADLVVNSVLKDAVSDLRAWTAGLKADGTSLAQLDALADQFNSRAARINGLTISEFGGILNEKEYTLLLSHAIPDFYEAFFNEIGRTVGMAPRVRTFPGLGRTPPQTDFAKSTLAEQLATIAVDKLVEKVMEEVNDRVKNAKQFAVDIMGQAQWTAAAVAATAHLKDFVKGGDIIEVVSGASLSFRVFNEPTPNWATIEVPGGFDEPQLSSVMIVGPDTFADVSNGVQSLFDSIKQAVSYGISPLTNPNKYKNRSQQKKHQKALKMKIAAAQSSANALQNTIANTYSYPGEVLRGCVFSSIAGCAQLYYEDGFDPVYRYDPPSGFSGFSGLPVPIVFIVQNQLTGEMYFGTPIFLPAPK
jgi:hypothetical protein